MSVPAISKRVRRRIAQMRRKIERMTIAQMRKRIGWMRRSLGRVHRGLGRVCRGIGRVRKGTGRVCRGIGRVVPRISIFGSCQPASIRTASSPPTWYRHTLPPSVPHNAVAPYPRQHRITWDMQTLREYRT
eukprot:2061360-Rhodomonas_salina.2